VLGVVFGLHDGVDNRMQGSFFWSIVSCCDQCTPAGAACSDKTSNTEAICVENNHTWTLVNAQDCPVNLAAKYDVHYPDTLINYGKNVSFIAGCDVPALPKENAFWSHSDFCPNWGYVKEYIQDLNATRGLFITFFSLLFVPIGAGVADKQGRKPILFFGFLMGCALLFAVCLLQTLTVPCSCTASRVCWPTCSHPRTSSSTTTQGSSCCTPRECWAVWPRAACQSSRR